VSAVPAAGPASRSVDRPDTQPVRTPTSPRTPAPSESMLVSQTGLDPVSSDWRLAKQLIERGEYGPAVEKMASVVEARPEELEVIAHDLFARFMAEPLGSMGQRSATARKLFDQFAELSKKHREEPVISYFYGRML